MPFHKFSIPPKDAEKTGHKDEYQCNARIRIEGQEAYCPNKFTGMQKRCPDHDLAGRMAAIREEARLENSLDLDSVKERVEHLKDDRRNLTRLDDLILNSLATIQELEIRYPLQSIEPKDAAQLARLREQHADLVNKRLDLEVKLKKLLDANFIFDEAARLFEQNIVDKSTQKLLLEGVGDILDKCVKAGNAVSQAS